MRLLIHVNYTSEEGAPRSISLATVVDAYCYQCDLDEKTKDNLHTLVYTAPTLITTAEAVKKVDEIYLAVKEQLAAQKEKPPCLNAVRIKGTESIQHIFNRT